MFEFNQFDNDIEWNGTKTTAELSDNSVMSFSAGDRKLLEILPISFGVVSESSGIVKKIRKHNSLDDLSVSMETETVFPFGTEPVISRFYEFAFNHCKVTSDIDIRKGVSAEKLSVDSLSIPGVWKKAGIIRNTDSGTLEMSWINLAEQEVFFESDKTFLAVVLEDENGFLFEIGTGNDLWRWNTASSSGVKSSFKMLRSDKAVSISRDIFVWETETPVPARNWRFHWYFSWLEKTEGEKTTAPSKLLPMPEKDLIPPKGKTLAYDFKSATVNESALARFSGKYIDHPCLQDNAPQNLIRRLIRSAIQKNSKHKITICNIEPHICDNPAHLERPGKDALLHWDIINILDYALWANRQIVKGKSKLFLVPESDFMRSIPSMAGLGN